MTNHSLLLHGRDDHAPFFPVPLHASPFTFPSLKYCRAAETLHSHGRKKFEKSFQKMLAKTGGGVKDQHTTTMKKISTLLFSAVALLSSAVSPSLHAAILLDNTSQPINTGIGWTWEYWFGLSFTTGSQGYTLDSLTLVPATHDNPGTVTGSIIAELFAADGNYHPTGPVISSETFLNVPFAALGNEVAWTGSFLNTLTVNANSSYVLKLSNSIGAGSVTGVSTNPNAPVSTGTSGLTFDGRVFEPAWAPGTVFGPLASAQWLKLEGDVASAAVPEPGQVAASLLLLAGIGGYVFLKRRKAAKPALATVAA